MSGELSLAHDPDRPPVQIAITGGIACGKSEVGKLLTSFGLRVLDTDIVGHDVIRQGQPAHEELLRVFGEEIRNSLGEIDRSRLGSLVFENREKRLQLNKIVHPRIREAWSAWMDERRQSKEPAAAMIPLLFESGADDWPWDAIVCVSSTPELVHARLRARGHSEEEALRRVAAQLPLAEKETRSDFIISNHTTLKMLALRTREVLNQITRRSPE